jgi:carboxyl-terminal processing protease
MNLAGSFTAAVLAALFLVAGSPVRAQDWHDRFTAAFDVVWQTVYETHFDTAFGGVDWDAVKTELRPRVVGATDQAAARSVIREMLNRLGQSHFDLLSAADSAPDAPLGEATVLVDVRATTSGVLITRVAPESPAGRIGIRAGDKLVAVDGVLLPNVETGTVPSVARTRAIDVWLTAIRALSGKTGSLAKLRLVRPNGTDYAVDVAREVEPGEAVMLGNLPPMRASLETTEVRTLSGKRVGVIAFNVWMAPLAEPIAQAIDRFRSADGLVIDLSGNVGGLVDMIRGIAGHVVNEPVLLGRMQMRSNTLEFRVNPRRATSDGRRVVPFSGPVAIVVDGLTASASECFAASLQGLHRARVFGTPTMGQALPALTKNLPNGDVLLYAVGDFVTSDGRRVEGTGVVPDDVVPVDPAALAAGRDGRSQAISWIDQGAGR